MSGPSFNALRAFEAAGRLLSFTRAAEELQVTPGAISQQIGHLEAWSGAPLFRRTGRQVFLTEAGQAALPLLTRAFEAMGEAAHVMRAPARPGRLMISAAPSFATKWLAPRLESFQTLFPGAEIWVGAEIALVDFSDPDIDLAIRYGRGDYEGVRVEKLLTETVLPVCAPSLIEGNPGLHQPEDLRHFTLIHDQNLDQDPSCPDWMSWLAARQITDADIEIGGGPRFSQASMVVEAAASGQGVALAKRTIAAADLASGRLVAPFADGGAELEFAYWVVWPRGRTQSPMAHEFVNWLKSEAHAEEFSGV